VSAAREARRPTKEIECQQRPAATGRWGIPAVQLHPRSAMALSNKHVSGADGRSLYRFDEDTAIPSVSHCVGECAGKWPGGPCGAIKMVYAAGVDPQLIGCIQRADGRISSHALRLATVLLTRMT